MRPRASSLPGRLGEVRPRLEGSKGNLQGREWERPLEQEGAELQQEMVKQMEVLLLEKESLEDNLKEVTEEKNKLKIKMLENEEETSNEKTAMRHSISAQCLEKNKLKEKTKSCRLRRKK